MGHDIDIRDGPKGRVIDQLYISGNWSSFPHWSIHDAHGHPGSLIARSLQEALDKYAAEGVKPNFDMGLDGWGQYLAGSTLAEGAIGSSYDDRETRPEVEHAMRCMHAGHIDRFLEVAKKNPQGYWYSDQVWKFTPLYGHVGVDPDDSDDPENEEHETPLYAIPHAKAVNLQGLYGIKTGNGVVYSYKHSVKGFVNIKTRDDAMDAAREASNNDDERAISWTMLALMLPK